MTDINETMDQSIECDDFNKIVAIISHLTVAIISHITLELFYITCDNIDQ